MSDYKDPVTQQIIEKQDKINKEGYLRKSTKKVNYLVVFTSLILLTGILIGLLRIVMNILS